MLPPHSPLSPPPHLNNPHPTTLTTATKVPSNGVIGVLTTSDAFEDNFIVPVDWRANAGRMAVRSQCWVECNAPGPSFRRNTKRGLWGTLRGRHKLRVPSPGAKVMERRFCAAWGNEGPRKGGEDIELRVASVRPWDGKAL